LNIGGSMYQNVIENSVKLITDSPDGITILKSMFSTIIFVGFVFLVYILVVSFRNKFRK